MTDLHLWDVDQVWGAIGTKAFNEKKPSNNAELFSFGSETNELTFRLAIQ